MSLARAVPPDPYDFLPQVPSFQLTSDDLSEGASVPLRNAYTSAGGQNVSPHLSWADAPEGTKSYVITCFDPDAPTPCGFWHWLVLDIPATITELTAGVGQSDATLPAGFHVAGDYGTVGYDGCDPPKGDQVHRYMFVVHALDVDSLGLDASASAAVVCFNLAFHTLARARLTGKFDY